MDIKDSKALKGNAQSFHKLLCLELKRRGMNELVVCSLSDYVQNMKLTKTK